MQLYVRLYRITQHETFAGNLSNVAGAGLSQNLPFVGYDARLDATTSQRGQAGSSVILARTPRIPLYASTDRASIGAMSVRSGTIDAR